MNTSPSAVKVLCYGDSNTWGQKPEKSGRFAADVRWTGQLQKLLGEKYYIVEEGLSARTTDMEYSRGPGRDGRKYLVPCLLSHNPLDIVVVMLGTNDLKIEYRRSAEDVAQALQGLVEDVREFARNQDGKMPKIILVSPILINDKAPNFYELYTETYDEESARESHNLAAAISSIAEQAGCYFVDAAIVSAPGEDGLHMNEASQMPLAQQLKLHIEKLTQ